MGACASRDHWPQMIFISAGFDAHYEDDMGLARPGRGGLRGATEQIKKVAEECCEKRIVSILEGGYSCPAGA